MTISAREVKGNEPRSITLFEYVSKLTENGSFIKLPSSITEEMESRSAGRSKGMFINIKTWREGKSEEKRGRDLQRVEKFTCLAISCDDSRMFYEHAKRIAPINARDEDYDEEKWDDLFHHIVIEISSELFHYAFKERFHKSASNILTILQNRIKEWQKKATIQTNKAEGDSDTGISVQVNIN